MKDLTLNGKNFNPLYKEKEALNINIKVKIKTFTLKINALNDKNLEISKIIEKNFLDRFEYSNHWRLHSMVLPSNWLNLILSGVFYSFLNSNCESLIS